DEGGERPEEHAREHQEQDGDDQECHVLGTATAPRGQAPDATRRSGLLRHVAPGRGSLASALRAPPGLTSRPEDAQGAYDGDSKRIEYGGRSSVDGEIDPAPPEQGQDEAHDGGELEEIGDAESGCEG